MRNRRAHEGVAHEPLAPRLGGFYLGRQVHHALACRQPGGVSGVISNTVIAREAKQSRAVYATLDCFASLAMTKGSVGLLTGHQVQHPDDQPTEDQPEQDRKSTRLNSSH